MERADATGRHQRKFRAVRNTFKSVTGAMSLEISKNRTSFPLPYTGSKGDLWTVAQKVDSVRRAAKRPMAPQRWREGQKRAEARKRHSLLGEISNPVADEDRERIQNLVKTVKNSLQ